MQITLYLLEKYKAVFNFQSSNLHRNYFIVYGHYHTAHVTSAAMPCIEHVYWGKILKLYKDPIVS